jgi:hypothetical protein
MTARGGDVQVEQEESRLPRRGTPQSLAGAGVLLVLVAAVPACSAPSSPAAVSTSTTTSTTSAATLPEEDPAEIAACVADAKTLETGLAAFVAERGAYPTPPTAWSAATYAGNYQPLTAASGGGPFLPGPPGTKYYVIEYDSAGHVWIAPPGAYGAYDKGQDFAVDPDICDAAVG